MTAKTFLKLGLFSSMVSVTTISTYAQNFTPKAQLKKGDKINIAAVSYIDAATKESMQAMGMATPEADSLTTISEYEVKTESNDKLIFSSKMSLDESTKAMFTQMGVEEPKEKKYNVVTAKDGSNPTLENEADALKSYNEQIDEMIQGLTKNPSIAPMLGMFQPMFESMKKMVTPEIVNQSLLADLSRLFTFQGETIKNGSPKQLKNHFTSSVADGMRIKTDVDYRLVNYNEGKKTAIISATYVTDKAYLLKQMYNMLKSYSAMMPAGMGNGGASDEQIMEDAKAKVANTNLNFNRQYYFDLKTGIPSLIVEKSVQKDESGKDMETIKKYYIKIK